MKRESSPFKDKTVEEHIGERVEKQSHKPFLSGKIVNTVAGVGVNPYTERCGFYFVEDDSIVEARTCTFADASS